MATKKFVIYYTISIGGKINRDYPDFTDTHTDAQIKAEWQQSPKGVGRYYQEHESHDDYTSAYAAAGLIGADELDVRRWLLNRVVHLKGLRAAALQAAAAKLIPAASGVQHAGHKPGDIVRDQHGRSGRVPNVPMEVFRDKPIDPDAAHRAVQDMCKGG